jgi:hypothetical protein
MWRPLVGALAAFVLFAQVLAQSGPVNVVRDGDRLRVSSAGLSFLAGPPLDRLREGRTVTYVLTLSLRVGQSVTARVSREVGLSYDLWEERFSVIRLDQPKTSASRLTAAAVEAWCLDLLSLPVTAAPAGKAFVLQLECAARDDQASRRDPPSFATFTGLIDMLSRETRPAAPRWEAHSSPLRLSDLKDKTAK